MGFEIEEVVIRGEMPRDCIACGRISGYTCTLLFQRLTKAQFPTRPNWCPLISLAENERFGIFRLVGKGKPHINNEMWIESEE